MLKDRRKKEQTLESLLSHRREAKAQTSLRICIRPVSPESSFLTNTKFVDNDWFQEGLDGGSCIHYSLKI